MTTKRNKLSVTIISKNEAEQIAECLESVSWADEIVVVVDSGSSDSTRTIAGKYTDKVYDIAWRGFGPQKQAAVDLASHDWILSVDCDERVTDELAAEIKKILESDTRITAFTLPRKNFLGKKEIKHCGWYPDRAIKLFNRTRAGFSDSLIHESVITDGSVAHCKDHLLHYSFTGLGHILQKLNHYSELSAEQMFKDGRTCSVSDLTLRPFFAFFKTYFIRLGFLDGIEGLEISVTTAMLNFSKYIKLRELHKLNNNKI